MSCFFINYTVVDKVTYNKKPIYRISRPATGVFLLQQNIGLVFWNCSSTFNSLCWGRKVQRFSADSYELKCLKDIEALEKGSRKANLIPLQNAIEFLQQAKKNIDATHFLNFIQTASAGDEYFKQPAVPSSALPVVTDSPKKALTAAILTTVVPTPATAVFAQLAAAPPSLTLTIAVIADTSTPVAITALTAATCDSFTATAATTVVSATSVTLLPSFDVEPDDGCFDSPPASHTKHTSALTPVKPVLKEKSKKYTLSEEDFSDKLKVQLANLQTFWMQVTNTRRQEKPVNMTTHCKRKERLLGFLGWLKTHKQISHPTFENFDIEHNEEFRNTYEEYLDYLTEVRQLNSGTLVEHITAAIYVLKFLCVR